MEQLIEQGFRYSLATQGKKRKKIKPKQTKLRLLIPKRIKTRVSGLLYLVNSFGKAAKTHVRML